MSLNDSSEKKLFTNGNENRNNARTYLLVVTRGPCSEAPGLFQVDESHNLEAPSWELRRPLELDNSVGPLP